MASVSCNKNKTEGENPFFGEWDTPFGVPPFDRIQPEHYKPAFERGMELQLAEIEAIVADPAAPSFDNVILALDNSGDLLGTVSRMFGLITSAETNEQLQKVEEEVLPMMAAHASDIYMNEVLFNKVAEVYAMRDSLDDLQKRLTEKIYKRFVRSGALLSPEKKDVLRGINENLSTACMRFGNNILAANRDFRMVVDSADVAELPDEIKRAAAAEAEKVGEKGRYAFTLSKPSMIPFMTSSTREDLRRTLYEGYLNRCNYGDSTDNRALVNEIVRLRRERAKLLGYDTHADYMLENRMAENPGAVYAILDQLWEPALLRAKEELEKMRTIKLNETGNGAFNSWDWWHYAEKLRKQEYALDEQMLRPYFTLDNVQRGIFDLCNRLWGLTFKPLVNMPVYHKDCTVYEAFDADNTHLGVLIMDFFPRDGKAVGAWCGSYRDRIYRDGKKVADPIITIVCNFTPPASSRPALLTIDEAETFFHEFGHAIHGLMTDVPYQGLDGVEQDFVELPSQIMENWATEPEMLRRYAFHYNSNTPIPDDLIRKITASSQFNQGFMTTELLAAAFIDMDIHTLDPFNGVEVNEFESTMLNNRRGLIPEIAPRYRYPYFKHIFDSDSYSAGYYSYIWAEVLDKDAYAAFVSSGDIFNKEVAARFRECILSKGGSEDGMTMYRDFRGGDPSGDYLLYARGLKERPSAGGSDSLAPLPDSEIPPLEAAEIFGPGAPRREAPASDSTIVEGVES